jgi:Tol biopolymer transport system component
VFHPTRIEIAQTDGSARTVLVQDGRQPAPAPDGGSLAFVRSSAAGSALMVRMAPDASERALVPMGLFKDLASPRYSPQGDRLAFMAPGTFVGRSSIGPSWTTSLFGTSVASAHGFPWDVWLVGADGSGLRLLAQLGADDGTLSWSPDGNQVFVYGGTGSFLVDAATGEVTALGYVAGYGSTSWLPN